MEPGPAWPVLGAMVSLLKGVGYLVSTISVVLLGIVAWKGASEQPALFACLIAGMVASVLGMVLRWISHRKEQKEKAASGGQVMAPIAPLAD